MAAHLAELYRFRTLIVTLVLMQNIILGVVATNTPRQAGVVLIDPKQGVDYYQFEHLPHLHHDRPIKGGHGHAREVILENPVQGRRSNFGSVSAHKRTGRHQRSVLTKRRASIMCDGQAEALTL